MSRSARQKLNNVDSRYFEFVGEDDGNAARTRPLHFEEIMLIRKKRELSQSGNNININNDKHSIVESVKRLSPHNKDCRNGERALGLVRPPLKSEVEKVKPKDVDDNKLTKEGNHSEVKKRKIIHHPETFPKEIAGNKERDFSTRKGVLMMGNDKEVHASETKFRTRLSSEVRYKDDRDDCSIPIQDKAVGRVRNEPNVLDGRDCMMEPNVKQRYTNRGGGRSDRETKRMRRDLDLGTANDRHGAKPDPRRLQDIDISQRLVRKEFTESRHNGINDKKKLSGREHGKSNNRRSLSLSPRGQRRQLDSGRRHEDYPSKYLKVRSRRQLDVTDKSRFSSIGSGKHYRGHASSGELGRHSQRKREANKAVKTPSPSRPSPEKKTSGNYRSHEVSKSTLGGYSPRKRRSDKAVKTPPPSKQSPERKVAGWDIAPVGTEVITGGSLPDAFPLSTPATSSNLHELTNAVSAALSVMKPSVVSSLNVSGIKLSASIDSVQLTESTRPLRRLCIENIPASTSEKALMQCMNSNLLSAGANHIHGTEPCISCIIHHEKGLALVEFLTPEDASSALLLDGYHFCGAILKVRRPKDFVEVATSQTSDARKEDSVHVISNTVDDLPHKIFIGGISEVLSSEMLMEIAGVFGELKGFHFSVSEDAAERCAFMEYMDPSATLKACAALNGIKLGGQVLTVVLADSSSEIDGNRPQYAIPNYAMPLLQKPTRVLKLRNLFPPDSPMLLSQKEMDEIIEDVRLECTRFGMVMLVNVVKHDVSLPLMPDDCVVTDDAEQNFRAEERDIAEKMKEHTEHKSGIEQTSSLEIIDDSNCYIVPKEREEEHQIVAFESFNREESLADHRDENYPVNDCFGDNEYRMCQPDKEGNINEATYQIHSDEAVAGEIRPINNLNEGCCSQDSQECDVTPCEDNHVEEKTPGEQDSYTGEEDERESSPNPEPVRALMTDISSQKSVDEKLLPNLARILEPGCVLVEYKRTESSREAAHCLHGRLFNDRIVTVEYVPEDLYVAKFGKV